MSAILSYPKKNLIPQCVQLFMSVCVEQAGIDYHVVLAQNALQQCLEVPELQDELVACLARQTAAHAARGGGVQVTRARAGLRSVSAREFVALLFG